MVKRAKRTKGGGVGLYGLYGGILGFVREVNLARDLMCHIDSLFRTPVRFPIPQGTVDSSSAYHT